MLVILLATTRDDRNVAIAPMPPSTWSLTTGHDVTLVLWAAAAISMAVWSPRRPWSLNRSGKWTATLCI